MAWQVKQSIDFGDTHLFRPVGDLYDLISRTDLTFLDHPEIKSRTLMRNKQRRHLRIAHANANAVASHSRLRHLEYRATDPITIADADFIIWKAVNGQVFAKLSVLEVVPLKVLLPVSVGVELIDHHCAMFSAMSLQVTLAIAIEIETARHQPSRHRLLPDSGANHLALPLDVARQTYIH